MTRLAPFFPRLKKWTSAVVYRYPERLMLDIFDGIVSLLWPPDGRKRHPLIWVVFLGAFIGAAVLLVVQ